LACSVNIQPDDERAHSPAIFSDTEMIMRTLTTLSLALAATTAVATGAYAAEQATQPPMQASQEQKAANIDFGKLSVQGA
jgi:cytochrome c-type biogenesis protein CcmH/NrfG